MRTLLFLLSAFLIISCQKEKQSDIVPLPDGDPEEYELLGVEPIQLADSVNLYFHQNEHFVWICYTYPSESYGTTDIEITTEKVKEPLNLHVSGQIGEWPVNNPELAPENPESDKWWNMKGWIANEVWPNGMDRSREPPRYKFKNASAREIQLSKRRFGRGEWRISMQIRAINGPDGYFSIEFPETEKPYTLMVN